jgi:hypothetical protein
LRKPWALGAWRAFAATELQNRTLVASSKLAGWDAFGRDGLLR